MSLLERVYFFHNELTRNRYPNARTLMREFEISQPTARRDIAYLRDRLLAPLEFDQKRHGFYYTEAGFNLPFANTPRIVFLLGMLNRLARETGLSNLPEIRQLEKRLAALVDQDNVNLSDSIDCEWIEIEHPHPAIFDTVIEAIIKKRQLTITYQSPQKQSSNRTIEPLKLLNYQGRWYLYSWCALREAPRMFHLARISTAKRGEKTRTRRQYLSSELDQSFGIFKGKPVFLAKIRFSGTAAELVKRQIWHKEQLLESSPNGSVLLTLPISDDREIKMKILQYGAQATVEAPPHLAQAIRSEALLISANYTYCPV